MNNSLSRYRVSIFLLILGTVQIAAEVERPNVVWITSEDNSAYWLGCYGNENAQTPNIDKLAERGVLYENAYSNAPVCAVARSTLILGNYATTMGLQHMRSRYAIPEGFKTYAEYLREAGYYVTNARKTDFNFPADLATIFDECSDTAHWRNRAPGQPFFAIFNTTVSHESSIFPESIENRRKRGIYPPKPRIDPGKVDLPPYLPDRPEIREDHAAYHDAIAAMDAFVGERLAELEEAGLADDTLVFYYSDHGGVIPRTKRFLYETGTHVPLVVYVPEKWAHLAPGKPGSRESRLVSFVDFGPALLSLCGIPVPEHMEGQAFLGDQARVEPRTSVFLYGHRFDSEILKFERAVTDGKYRYIRNFHPLNPQCYKVGYPLRQAGWQAWLRTFEQGKTNALQGSYWVPEQPVDALFNTDEDPWEVTNLASDPWNRSRLEGMKADLYQTMLQTRDTGVVPESLFHDLVGQGTIYAYVRNPEFPFERNLKLLFLATDREPENFPVLEKALHEKDPVSRYWALMGCAYLGRTAASALPEIRKQLQDPLDGIRYAAACAMLQMGYREEAVMTFRDLVESPVTNMTPVDALYQLMQLEEMDVVTPDLVERIRVEVGQDKNLNYVLRAAESVYDTFHPEDPRS